MLPHHEAPLDDALDALLRDARPTPTLPFAARLERGLLPERPARAARLGRFGVLAGAAGGLASVLAIAALAGGGPLVSGDSDAAKARPGCTTVYVTRVEAVGGLVQRADGTVTVETTKKPVSRAEERCR